MEYGMLGLSTGEHPMSFYREMLTSKGILDSAGVKACENGQQVRAAGMAVVHQSPPTAKGMHFLTLEDEAGFINVVIPPQVYRRYRRVIRGAAFLVVQGMVESKGNVTNLKARRMRALDAIEPGPALLSSIGPAWGCLTLLLGHDNRGWGHT